MGQNDTLSETQINQNRQRDYTICVEHIFNTNAQISVF